MYFYHTLLPRHSDTVGIKLKNNHDLKKNSRIYIFRTVKKVSKVGKCVRGRTGEYRQGVNSTHSPTGKMDSSVARGIHAVPKCGVPTD